MNSQNAYGCPSILENGEGKPTLNGSLKRLSTTQGQELNFWSFPNPPQDQERLNTLAQTPDESGAVLCWRMKKGCSNPDCADPKTGLPHKFSAAERGLWNCPVCGKDRHCRNLTRLPNRGCHLHGGKTPTGFALPQTKTGEHSRYLRVGSLRADYERLRASESLYNTDESIALLKAHLNEIVAEYDGGASRLLLKQMKQNRNAYKREMRSSDPDPALMRQLDRELDQMIAQGSASYQIFDEFIRVARDIDRLIAARDQHVHGHEAVLTADKAWMLMAQVEETFRVGAEKIVSIVNEEYVRAQCEILGLDFNSLSPARVQELVQIYRDQRQKEKRGVLAYASQRFNELAGTGITATPPNKP